MLANLSSLQQRIITAAVLAPLFLLALYCGGILLTAVIVAAILVGYNEWLSLCYKSVVKFWPPALEYGAYAFLTAAILLTFLVEPKFGIAALIVGFLFVVIMGHFYLEQGPKNAPAQAAFGIFYLGLPAIALIWLRNMGYQITPNHPWQPLTLLIAQVWATDIFAYIAGRSIGGRKLAPSISPNKTWSGLLGGMTASSLTGGGLAGLWNFEYWPLFFAIGFFLGLVAQMGDLFESHMKRKAGFKDSGTLFPGHGGVLDRIDGLLTAAPVFALILFL